MSHFQTVFEGLIRDKHGKIVKFSQKLVDKLLQLVIQTPYTETSPLRSPEFITEFLWRNYSDSSTDSHVLLISAALSSCEITSSTIVAEQEQLQSFLTRLVQIYERKSTPSTHKMLIVRGFTALCKDIENEMLRESIEPISSILSWSELEFRPLEGGLGQAFDYNMKNLQELSPKDKVQRVKLSSVLHTLCLDVTNDGDNTVLVTEIIKFFCLLLSQIPMRLFTRIVIEQCNVLFVLQHVNKNTRLLPWIELLKYHMTFPIYDSGDVPGLVKTIKKLKEENTAAETLLQTTLYAKHKDTLSDLIYRTSSLSSDLQKTESELLKLETSEINELLTIMKISTKNINISKEQKILLLLTKITPALDCTQILETLSPLPNSKSLLQAHAHQLPLPPLGPSCLSLSDLFLRNYQALRADAFTTISEHVLNVITRFKKQKNQDKINGSSRHAVLIKGLDVEKKASFATTKSTTYHTTITLDLQSSPPVSLPEWADLKAGDVILIAKVADKLSSSTDPFLKEGLSALHSATVISSTKSKKTSKSVTIDLSVDPSSFHGNTEVNFKVMNIIIKLPPNIKYYKKPLDSISEIMDHLEGAPVDAIFKCIDGKTGGHDSWRFHTQASITLGKVNVENVIEALPGIQVKYDREKESKKRRVSAKDSETHGLKSIKIDYGHKKAQITEVQSTTDLTMLSVDQLKGLISSLYNGPTLISGASGTGKKFLISKVAELSVKNRPYERVLIVSKNEETLKALFKMVESNGVSSQSLFNMTDNASVISKIDAAHDELVHLLTRVDELAADLGEEGAWGNDPETAANFYKYHIQVKWERFLLSVKEEPSVQTVCDSYPLSKFDHFDIKSESLSDSLKSIIDHYTSISLIFDKISRLAPLLYLTKQDDKSDYLLSSQASIVGTTIDQLLKDSKKLIEQKVITENSNVIVMEASQMNDIEALYPLTFNPPCHNRMITFVGDEKNLGPTVFNKDIGEQSWLKKSLFERLVERGVEVIRLNEQFNRGGDVVSLLKKHYPELTSHAEGKAVISFKEVEGQLEEGRPGFYRNTKEAECAIDVAAELIESGVSLSDVVVLTPYESQKVLLQDVASAKLNVSPEITTLESFKGREKKNVVVSPVQTQKKLEVRESVAILSSGTEKIVIVCSKAMKAIF